MSVHMYLDYGVLITLNRLILEVVRYTAIAVNGAMEGALPQLVLLDDFVATL